MIMGVMDRFSGVIHLIPFNEPPSAEETTKAFIKKRKKKKKKKKKHYSDHMIYLKDIYRVTEVHNLLLKIMI